MLLAVRCPGCGVDGAAPCERCIAAIRPPTHVPRLSGVDHVFALTSYDAVGRELVLGLKYRNARAVVRWSATRLAALVSVPCDVVTWVPASPAHRHDRGYDQGRLLARAVARRLRIPCRLLLRRSAGPAQTDRSRTGRLRGPMLYGVRASPARVLVVDDVVTTGSSLAAAAEVCRTLGAREISAAVIAITPEPT